MEITQYFCTHCGQTRTYEAGHVMLAKIEKDAMCRQCLQGEMKKIER